MPPVYVKPYVKRGKTDAADADAEAICEAVTRPTMRFVAVKTPEQQAVLMLHKTRDLLVRQRTGLINALCAHLAEYGIVSGKGPGGKDKAWRDQQAGRRLYTASAGSRSHGGDAHRAKGCGSAAMSSSATHAQACEDRHCRARQQNSAGRLGADGAQRSLRGCRVIAILPAS